jgi:NCAIR mutase (PurE)-related protein
MEEKNFKILLKDQTEEIKRHGKMLLEEFQSQLKVIAEVQIEQGKKLDGHSRKLDILLEMVANNTENIEFIKSMLKRKVDIEEFEALTKRVMVLEKKLLPFK